MDRYAFATVTALLVFENRAEPGVPGEGSKWTEHGNSFDGDGPILLLSPLASLSVRQECSVEL